MASIRHRGNRTTERAFAGLLRARHVSGWALHRRDIVGRPDFYFADSQIAVFIDGCFWHGCPKCFQAPRQNARFWAKKIGLNRKRDQRVTRFLRRQGVKVIRLWEHDLEKKTGKVQAALKLLH